MKLTISIVLYHNHNELLSALSCILKSNVELHVYLMDNSSSDELRTITADSRVTYIYNNGNIGYGAAHNLAIERALQTKPQYHLVMNPDITFEQGTLEKIISYMDSHPEVGSLMPKVFNEDGSLQRLCKLLPTPVDLISRRFFTGTNWAATRNQKYELDGFDYESILQTQCLSGCFMFINVKAFEKSGLFDTRYFLYLEDYDLNRRISKYYRTIFFPDATIMHAHAQESYKNLNLLRIHVVSAIKYFNKWGWFIDKERSRLNDDLLRSIKQMH